MLTTCTCDNGFQGDTLLVPGPTSTTTAAPNLISIFNPTPAGSNSSILLCRFDTTNYTISALGPAPTPSAAVEILLQYDQLSPSEIPNWSVFQFSDTDTSSNDAAPQQIACDPDVHALLTWNNGHSVYQGFGHVFEWLDLLDYRNFNFPRTEQESGTFDIGGHSGCKYKENPAGLQLAGSLACQHPPGELACQADWRQYTDCGGFQMVPKLWCPLPV